MGRECITCVLHYCFVLFCLFFVVIEYFIQKHISRARDSFSIIFIHASVRVSWVSAFL